MWPAVSWGIFSQFLAKMPSCIMHSTQHRFNRYATYYVLLDTLRAYRVRRDERHADSEKFSFGFAEPDVRSR